MKEGVTPPPDMVLVPAGEFAMGSLVGEGDINEWPQHTVTLSAYWIDNTEVTNEQYGKFLKYLKRTGDHSKCFKGEPANKDHTPYGWTNAKRSGPKHPVVTVDWYDAYAYAAWAGKRLPTEAEWEKAARGTDGRKYPWGNDWDDGKCNNVNREHNVLLRFDPMRTAEVGSYPAGASPYGCLDMAGNVYEWCADYYWECYYFCSPLENPTGLASGGVRAVRGGRENAGTDLPDFRCAGRSCNGESFHLFYDYGFRCVRGL